MDAKVREYLAEIGRRGGRNSRRLLDPHVARRMVKLREARRAFREFRTLCFWSVAPDYVVTDGDIEWVADQLMKHGDRRAWQRGARLAAN